MTDLPAWLPAALAYIPEWLGYQMRATEQPGCAIAVAYKGEVVLEAAFGHADLAAGEALTPRHRFRVASHSKSFTATAIMKLREQGRVKLDDPAGQYGLRPVPRHHDDHRRPTAVSHRRRHARRARTAPTGSIARRS